MAKVKVSPLKLPTFAHFKNRLEQDEINLEKDVLILKAMRQEKLQGLTETSTEST